MSADIEREICQTIILPGWVWERLTEREKSLDREAFDNPHLPDVPFSQRIDLFLQIEITGWYNRVGGRPEGLDLDDGVPF